MEQFNLVLKDFANWKMDNVQVIEKLRSGQSLIYDRFEPVYAVLNDIYRRAVENEPLDEEMQTIFNVGFKYLHSQFEVVRIYYEKLFDSDCALFSEFDQLVGYLLFLSDFRSDLEDYEDTIDFSDLNDVEDLIETMIAQRDKRFEYAADRLNKAVEKVTDQLDFEYVSIIEIFLEIAENLNIDLEKSDAYVIGEDLDM